MNQGGCNCSASALEETSEAEEGKKWVWEDEKSSDPSYLCGSLISAGASGLRRFVTLGGGEKSWELHDSARSPAARASGRGETFHSSSAPGCQQSCVFARS